MGRSRFEKAHCFKKTFRPLIFKTQKRRKEVDCETIFPCVVSYCLTHASASTFLFDKLQHEHRQSFLLVSDKHVTAEEDKHLIKSHKMLPFPSSTLKILQQVGVFNFTFPVSLVE